MFKLFTSPKSIPALLTASAALLMLNSCGTHRTALRQTTPAAMPQGQEAAHIAEQSYSYWSDQEASAPLTVRIDLSEQTANFYRNGTKIGQSRVATGRAGHSTPTGSFTIMEKVAGKRSNLYGRIFDAEGKVAVSDADTRIHSIPEGGRYVGAPMPYWMRLTSSGIGMHVGNIPNPGSPASHGCVRMPPHMAHTLFQNAPTGTKVVIVQ